MLNKLDSSFPTKLPGYTIPNIFVKPPKTKTTPPGSKGCFCHHFPGFGASWHLVIPLPRSNKALRKATEALVAFEGQRQWLSHVQMCQGLNYLLGMVIPPFIGNPYTRYVIPYYGVEFPILCYREPTGV